MLRGITKFRCPSCGHIFDAFDIEDNATAGTVPVPCPRCGAKSYPQDLFFLGTIDPAPNIIGLLRSIVGKKSR